MTETLTANFRLGWQGRTLETEVTVPAGPTRPRILLPLVQRLTNQLVEMGEQFVAARGETISCRAGCGACCRQLVPLSETEARHVRDLVEAMPAPRREAVKARFADALARLTTAGLGETLRAPAGAFDATTLGMDYFKLGIPCPFLEDESCSVHPDRPIVCREYLVTSPAENCTAPTPETVRRVPTPGYAMTSFASLDAPPTEGKGIRWVPLVLALEWADAHPEPASEECGPDLFGRFMTALTKKKIPTPGGVVAPETLP